MNSPDRLIGVRSSKRAKARSNDDPLLHALLTATDANSILHAAGELLRQRGVRAPWALPELVPLREFTERHLSRKAKKVAPGTLLSLRNSLSHFGRHCRGQNLQEVQGEHVQRWVESLETAGYSPGSIHKMRSAVHAMFSRAVSLGFIRVNPCADVELPHPLSVVERQPLLDADLSRLLAFLRAEHEDEWVTLVLLCRYAGLRLGDAAALCGSNLVTEGDALYLRLTPQKTGAEIEIPCFEPLASHLRALVREGPLCPARSTLTTSALSHQFLCLMERAGVPTMERVLANGRVVHQITVHSLRHAFVTSLAERGVPEHIRMKLSAHRSVASHRRYEHTGGAALHSQLQSYFA